MREIGTISNYELADRFVNFIRSKGIEAEVRKGETDEFEVWILFEQQLSQSKTLWKEFNNKPHDLIYIEKAKEGVEIKKIAEKEMKEEIKKQARFKRKITNQSHSFNATISLIVISGLLYLIQSRFQSEIQSFFSFSQYRGKNFPEILNGQIWRLFTPIFLHATFWHLFFNMMWLFQLGQMIERERGNLYLLFLTLMIGSLANTAQYLVTGGNFLGMSGVVYGLFGFIWVKSHVELNQNYFLSSFTIGFLLVYYLLCVFGIFGNIANTNHGVGLCSGILFGFLSTGYFKNIKNIKKLNARDIMIGLLPFILAAMGVISDSSH